MVFKGVRFIATESRQWCQGLGTEIQELVLNRDRIPVWEDRKVLEIDGTDSCNNMNVPMPMLNF